MKPPNLRTRVTISISTERSKDRVKLILEPDNLRGFLNSIRPFTKGHRMIADQLVGNGVEQSKPKSVA